MSDFHWQDLDKEFGTKLITGDGDPATNGLFPAPARSLFISNNGNVYISDGSQWIDVLNNGTPGATGPIGPSGASITGPQGPAGPQGPTGVQGPQGLQGPVGITGAVGPMGPTGVQGPQGPVGVTGAVGPMGPTGVQGPQGVVGVQGPAGPQGATGVQGPQGTQGPVGVTGPQGDIGVTGTQGPQGPQGVTGAMGPTGVQGPQGTAGPTGAVGPTGKAGPRWQGLYDPTLSYLVNDLVQYQGSSYIAIDNVPPDGGTPPVVTDSASNVWNDDPRTFTVSAWTKGNTTATAGAATGPDNMAGSATALLETSASGFHELMRSMSVVAKQTAAFEYYVKANGRTIAAVWAYDYGDSQFHVGYVDLVSGAVYSVTAGDTLTMADMGNGWWRLTFIHTAVGSTINMSLATATANGTNSFAGDPTKGLLVWGAQAETNTAAPTFNMLTPGTTGANAVPPSATYWNLVSQQGLLGVTGATGAQGPQGIAGPQGPQGPTGVQGPQGVQGITGVAGPQGATGIQGPQGTQGAVGVQGPAGTQGATGVAGPQGPQGTAGPAGVQGATGVQGGQGPQGTAGSAGPQGPTGLQGPQGAQGISGPAGPQGPQGIAGPQGPQGAAGPTGAAGPPGPQGQAGQSYIVADWANNYAYALGDNVGYGGLVYTSVQDGNIGHTPYNNTSWWVPAS